MLTIACKQKPAELPARWKGVCGWSFRSYGGVDRASRRSTKFTSAAGSGEHCKGSSLGWSTADGAPIHPARSPYHTPSSHNVLHQHVATDDGFNLTWDASAQGDLMPAAQAAQFIHWAHTRVVAPSPGQCNLLHLLLAMFIRKHQPRQRAVHTDVCACCLQAGCMQQGHAVDLRSMQQLCQQHVGWPLPAA